MRPPRLPGPAAAPASSSPFASSPLASPACYKTAANIAVVKSTPQKNRRSHTATEWSCAHGLELLGVDGDGALAAVLLHQLVHHLVHRRPPASNQNHTVKPHRPPTTERVVMAQKPDVLGLVSACLLGDVCAERAHVLLAGLEHGLLLLLAAERCLLQVVSKRLPGSAALRSTGQRFALAARRDLPALASFRDVQRQTKRQKTSEAQGAGSSPGAAQWRRRRPAARCPCWWPSPAAPQTSSSSCAPERTQAA